MQYHPQVMSYLELILGPMYSGKTSRLIQLYNQYKFCNVSTLVINHSLDTRYDELLLSSHDKIKIECVQTDKLMDHIDAAKEVSVILINEGQFFDDLYEFVTTLLNNKEHPVKIHIASLDGDFERKKMGGILDLIPYADKVQKLSALCSICRNSKAIFSKRITSETTQVVVGSENYLPTCRKCY